MVFLCCTAHTNWKYNRAAADYVPLVVRVAADGRSERKCTPLSGDEPVHGLLPCCPAVSLRSVRVLMIVQVVMVVIIANSFSTYPLGIYPFHAHDTPPQQHPATPTPPPPTNLSRFRRMCIDLRPLVDVLQRKDTLTLNRVLTADIVCNAQAADEKSRSLDDRLNRTAQKFEDKFVALNRPLKALSAMVATIDKCVPTVCTDSVVTARCQCAQYGLPLQRDCRATTSLCVVVDVCVSLLPDVCASVCRFVWL